ncbi:MAG: SagB/ThcOx family dehydrogenase [Bacteroidales bacterium]|nr:SagB/ThcOx family dehydrogenase [Bacteroidales bacterium]
MKTTIILFLAMLFTSNCFAQSGETISLPEPQKEGGMPLMQALNQRHSSRNFIDKNLSDQQLSDLLWCAYGVNREGEGKRTAPSAHNRQEIDVYVIKADGAFLYDAKNNQLLQILSDDIRAATGTQNYVKDAAINLLYVLDKSKVPGDDENGKLMNAMVATGAIVQNVYLYSASEGLGTVVRGSFDGEKLAEILKLKPEQQVIMSQTVGYTK